MVRNYKSIDKVVVTLPNPQSDIYERKRLVSAMKLADLEITSFIHENSAALYYYLHENNIWLEKMKKIMIFNIGH